jgi:2-polyprenyl-3-methyl-5-hydroxy-6-metoxy-1,4-benzoquinol methylase
VITVATCAVCGSTELSPFSRVAPGPDHLHSAQVRCRTCGLFISQPRADVAEMDAYYRSRYYETHWADAEPLWQLNLRMHARHTLPALDALAGAWLPKPGSRVLEVGCGYGSMLMSMVRRGYRVVGTELSAKAAAFCRSKELDVVISRVPPVRPGSFDVVIARHVIEHVSDPREFVQTLVAAARPGGVIFIETENSCISQYAWERIRARALWRPLPFRSSRDHTYVFAARHLERLLREEGCSEVRTMSFDEQADRESLHWRLYKGLFRTIDRAMGGGELLAAAGRLPLRGSAS